MEKAIKSLLIFDLTPAALGATPPLHLERGLGVRLCKRVTLFCFIHKKHSEGIGFDYTGDKIKKRSASQTPYRRIGKIKKVPYALAAAAITVTLFACLPLRPSTMSNST
jgi:hypothetical protein